VRGRPRRRAGAPRRRAAKSPSAHHAEDLAVPCATTACRKRLELQHAKLTEILNPKGNMDELVALTERLAMLEVNGPGPSRKPRSSRCASPPTC
jgi:hypothetical protein